MVSITLSPKILDKLNEACLTMELNRSELIESMLTVLLDFDDLKEHIKLETDNAIGSMTTFALLQVGKELDGITERIKKMTILENKT